MASDVSTLVWLRDDLRVDDNPALAEAATLGLPMTVVFVLDEESSGIRRLGGATRWWLHHSLTALAASLAARGSRLVLRRGPAAGVIAGLAAETSAQHLFWNRRYGLPERTVDAAVEAWALGNSVTTSTYKANLLFDPWTVRTGSGTAYKVFTPFWRTCLAGHEVREPRDAPDELPAPAPAVEGGLPRTDDLGHWGLLPRSPDWSRGLAGSWQPGEDGAHCRLQTFLEGPAEDYATGRNVPGVEGTSRLSPHLRFGEISPFRVWHGIRQQFPGDLPGDLAVFRAELGWREFC